MDHIVATAKFQIMNGMIKIIWKCLTFEYQTELESFFGLIRFYCTFVKDFARLDQALTYMLEKGQKLKW